MHLGAEGPRIRKLTQQTLRVFAVNEHDEVLDTVASLWAQPLYDLKLAAVYALAARQNTLSVADLALCESMIREAGTYGLTDPMAINVVAGISIAATGEDAIAAGEVLDRWSADHAYLLRRAALLSQLPLVITPDGDPSRFFRYADSLLQDPKLLIRKAIGRVLREMGRNRPDMVYAWLLARVDRVSGITLREGMKHLDEAQGEALVAAFWDE